MLVRGFLKLNGAVALSLCAFLSSCTKEFEGKYVDPDTTQIISEGWNETDLRTTAQSIVKGVLSRPWIGNYQRANGGKKPIVVVDEVENRTDEHIDVKALTEFISDELINSGEVRFVNKEAREKILAEIKYQESGEVNAATAQKRGRQIGAQYFVGGAITSIVQQNGGKAITTYQTNMTLTNLETSEIEWSDKFRIKKETNRAKSKL